MELRKDPITRSWVITGDDQDSDRNGDFRCLFCPESGQPLHVVASMPTVNGNPWSARAVVHPNPLYRVEGDPSRAGNGLYDTMQPIGAHEVIIENARHDRQLWNCRRPRDRAVSGAVCAAHPGPEERRALQIRQRPQELWSALRCRNSIIPPPKLSPPHLSPGASFTNCAPPASTTR